MASVYCEMTLEQMELMVTEGKLCTDPTEYYPQLTHQTIMMVNCDRCNKFQLDEWYHYHDKTHISGSRYRNKKLDMCADCYKKCITFGPSLPTKSEVHNPFRLDPLFSMIGN
jgi:hypothetical protein